MTMKETKDCLPVHALVHVCAYVEADVAWLCMFCAKGGTVARDVTMLTATKTKTQSHASFALGVVKTRRIGGSVDIGATIARVFQKGGVPFGQSVAWSLYKKSTAIISISPFFFPHPLSTLHSLLCPPPFISCTAH